MVEISAILLYIIASTHIADCYMCKFLDSITGEIHGGNFTYFSLQQTGFVPLELISNSGDCDMYISQYKTKPNFEPNSHCLASTSCGLDKIVIPKSFKRPLAIGVYGHPSHKISTFTLNIYQIIDSSDADNDLDELYAATKYSDFDSYAKGLRDQHFTYYYWMTRFDYLIDFIGEFFKNSFLLLQYLE